MLTEPDDDDVGKGVMLLMVVMVVMVIMIR